GDGDDASPYAQFGADKDDSTNELWVALAEKAFAQLNESGWTNQGSTNSYLAMNVGGSAANIMHILTGLDAHQTSMYSSTNPSTTTFTSDQIVSKLNSGKLLVLSTPPTTSNPQILGHHAYTLVGYDATTGKFKLFNPHGIDAIGAPGILELTWSD